MNRTRLLQFLVGPELGLASTLLFVGLYVWPFLAFDRASVTFRFIFVAWCVHIALIAARSLASQRLEARETAGNGATEPPAE